MLENKMLWKIAIVELTKIIDCKINSSLLTPFPVFLMGGQTPYEGNVYAHNPVTGITGPIADHNWRINEVSGRAIK